MRDIAAERWGMRDIAAERWDKKGYEEEGWRWSGTREGCTHSKIDFRAIKKNTEMGFRIE